MNALFTPYLSAPLRRVTGSLGALFLLLVASSFGNQAEASTKYAGRYVFRQRLTEYSRPSPTVIDFTVQQSGCSWRIDLAPIRENGALISYQCDGRFIYKRRGRAGESALENNVTIYDGPYPPSDDWTDPTSCLLHLQHIWIGYAACCVMAPPSGEARHPFPLSMEEFSRPERRTEYRFVGDSTKIGPLAVEILDTRGAYLLKETAPLVARGVWTRFPEYLGRFTHFEFGTVWSDFSNGVIPERCYAVVCSITNSAEVSFTLDLPQTGVPCQIYDRRATSDGYAMIEYVTDTGIPDVDGVEFKRIKERSPKLSLVEDAQRMTSGVVYDPKPMPLVDTRKFARWILYLSPLGATLGVIAARRFSGQSGFRPELNRPGA